MSVQAMSWVFDHSAATLGARLVALSVANHADKYGRNAWAAVGTYAGEAHLSERQTQRALKVLRDMGELREVGKHGDRADRLTRIYEFPGMDDGVSDGHPVNGHEVTSATARGDTHDADGVTPTSPKPSLNRPELTSLFAEFWKTYPRKVGKGAARTAFASALKKADAERITAAAGAYAQQVRGVEPKFVAHPATWLRAERWDDEEQQSPSSSSISNGLAWAECSRCGQDRRIGELVDGICTTCRSEEDGAVSA